LIELTVEGGTKSLFVQQTLLLQASEWFENALKDRFKEGITGTINFSETDQATLERFVYWVLTKGQPLVSICKDGPCICTGPCLPAEEHATASVRLWVFAHKHFLPQLQNMAMTALFDSASSPIKIETIQEAYQGSPDNSKLRRFMIGRIIEALKTGPGEPGGISAGDLEIFAGIPGFITDISHHFRKYMVARDWKPHGGNARTGAWAVTKPTYSRNRDDYMVKM
jgi:hypothetical protein